jgi:hypothetical protein
MFAKTQREKKREFDGGQVNWKEGSDKIEAREAPEMEQEGETYHIGRGLQGVPRGKG